MRFSRMVSSPLSESRAVYSNPKYSAAATKACSSGDDAESSSFPWTYSSSTEWFTARFSASSRLSQPGGPSWSSACSRLGCPSASSKLQYVEVCSLHPTKAGKGPRQILGDAAGVSNGRDGVGVAGVGCRPSKVGTRSSLGEIGSGARDPTSGGEGGGECAIGIGAAAARIAAIDLEIAVSPTP